jgi:hypothetical protein
MCCIMLFLLLWIHDNDMYVIFLNIKNVEFIYMDTNSKFCFEFMTNARHGINENRFLH